MRLIDADELLKSFRITKKLAEMTLCDVGVATWNTAEAITEGEPTIDAVEVVRCKDCKWQPETIYGIRGAECNQLWCVCFNTWVPMDHYCSKGERKDTQ